MFFQHIYDKTLAQASYLIGCQKTGEALVIDPKRDVDTYLDLARQNNLRITHITETHIHADFLSGSRELAALTGATLYLSDEGGSDWQYQFAHQALKNGDVLRVGNLTLTVLHTPGHTPESISLLLTDHPATHEPVMLFTGDFVFVGDVGRPDLLEKAAGLVGTKEAGAHQMHQSLETFQFLPDFVQVWPGHGAGSACGKALGAVPGTTVGYEKIRNWAFRYADDLNGFTATLLADQPEPPTYFATMKHLNRVDRPLLTHLPSLPRLTPQAVAEALARGIQLVDTRPKADVADGFVPGSLTIQANNAFATWMGWFMTYTEPFILVAAEAQLDSLTRQLMRIGLDTCLGYISEIDALEVGQQPVVVIDLNTFRTYLSSSSDAQVIDLRSASEYAQGHVAGAESFFIGTLSKQLNRLNRNKPVVLYCQGGDRAAIGYSVLVRNGFTNVLNYAGSMNEWMAGGNPVVPGNNPG